jgi:two-component system LytT family response regulator
MRVLIVDDEDLARGLLREMLAPHPDVEIAGECANGFEAVKSAAQLKPDLVFLDVRMPKLDGFEVLELIDPTTFVVFVTAYDEYAMRAFDAHAVDYLLKPFDAARLARALDRARERLGHPGPDPAALGAAARPPGRYLERLVVKDGPHVRVIHTAQLDWVEAQDDYVALHSGGKAYLKQQTIASLEEALDPAHFVRLHRSSIVNLERVVRLEPYTKDTRLAILADGTRLQVSRAGYARLKDLIG